jgi:hypothetical protein
MVHDLREMLRELAGRNAQPTAAVGDLVFQPCAQEHDAWQGRPFVIPPATSTPTPSARRRMPRAACRRLDFVAAGHITGVEWLESGPAQ